MAESKYVDNIAAIQVIGCALRQPSLLQGESGYFFKEEDFTSELHRVIFGAIYNLCTMGTQILTPQVISDYLETHPKSKAIYDTNSGNAWVVQAKEDAELGNFDYNYNRLKKMTLLRGYAKSGIDVNWVYNPDLLDPAKRERQEEVLNNLSLEQISDMVEDHILQVRYNCVDNTTGESIFIGEGLEDLLHQLTEVPEQGSPLFGDLVNTVTKGARLGKLYIRSAASGIGKTRSMVADACTIACNRIFNLETNKWEDMGICQSALFITTELETSEIQTMALAFLSGVNEEHILLGTYEFGELERVQEAVKVLKSSLLYIEEMFDFGIKDVENTIKRNLRVRQCQYVFWDYLHTSMKLLEDISSRSGVKNLREDNVLFLLSVKLKEIATEFGVFIMTATQLNADWKTDSYPDQNLLRGAKSIADKCDMGMILLETTENDKKGLENIVKEAGIEMPNVKLSVYKNRRGSFTHGYLWMRADRGICRFVPIFATDYNYNLIYLKSSKINVK